MPKVRAGAVGLVLVTLLAVAAIVSAACGDPTVAPRPTTVSQPTAATDRDVLVALYNAANGTSWDDQTNWLSDRPTGEWYGVTTDANGRVTELALDDNQLTGAIPPELGHLTNLEALFLDDNRLAGSIPPELGNLMNLEALFLSDNQLTGSVPPEMGNLMNLEQLFLNNNRLTGNIPPELGNLADLEWLFLNNNRLTGNIPPELGNLADLEWLFLNDNRLTGGIPPELGSLTNLDRLALHDNRLTGSIPLELGNLANLDLLFLDGNRLAGCLPNLWAGISASDLDKTGLPFCGVAQATAPRPKPDASTTASDRDALVALYNAANGVSWEERTNWLSDRPIGQWHGVAADANDRVIILKLDDNRLAGEIPPELGNLANLKWLLLDYNQLTGASRRSWATLAIWSGCSSITTN